ncbi:hypothetical protein Tco_1051656 [Tanacetum coccineum]
MTPPPGFSTPPQIPNNTTSERPPVITIVFSATSPKNTPFEYRASTSANPNPMISPAFMEANYEIEPRPQPNREATPTLWPRSLVVRKQRERFVRFEEAPNKEDENKGVNLPPLLTAHLGRNGGDQSLRSSLTFVHRGHQSSTNIGGNLPPNGTLLSHHAQPFIPSSLHTPTGLVPIHVNPYSQPSAGLVNGKTPNFPFQT